MRITKCLILIASLLIPAAMAHEGHEHGPSAVQAPKGGVMRSLETVHLELVAKGKNLKIYPYALNLQSAAASKFTISLSAALPKKKAAPLKFDVKGDHWESSFEAKGAHRFTLELTIEQGGHSDKVTWVVEPKKN